MSGGGGTTTTVQQSDPWKEQIPYLKQGFQNAQQWYDSSNPQYYNFPTTIPYSDQTQQALQQQQALATGGSPLIGAAQGAVTDIAGGGTNPYLDAMFQQGANQLGTSFRNTVSPSIDAYYNNIGGSPDNPSQQQQWGQALHDQYTVPMQDFATSLYGGQYSADQNRRLQAAGMAPEMYQLGYAPTQQLGQVGAAQEAKSLEELQAQMQQYQFEQNKPLDKLQQYMQLIGGANYGGTSTTTGPNPYATNPFGDVASGIGGLGMAALMSPKLGSHSSLKQDIEPADRKSVLKALAALPIMTWQYTGDSVRHIGPMAEDFRQAFGVGDGYSIHIGDWLGVLTVAIQELGGRQHADP